MFTRPEWLSEAAWRALRTFVQVVVSAVVVTLIVVLSDYQTSHVFDLNALYYDGLIAGVAAGLAALMNRRT